MKSLGQNTLYPRQYAPQLLDPISRKKNRNELQLNSDTLPFHGGDLWTVFELSWLNPKGKPEVAMLTIMFPVDSPYIVESKSMKLYFNSLNFQVFQNADAVYAAISKDLSHACGAAIQLRLQLLNAQKVETVGQLTGTCLDDLDVTITDYTSANPTHLRSESYTTNETLYTNLFRSHCPVTNQPDWASVQIKYSGKQILHSSLLTYLLSFREHQDFHESCVEKIFMDILKQCKPKRLTVYARFLRRGGIDINPFRSNFEVEASPYRLIRQ